MIGLILFLIIVLAIGTGVLWFYSGQRSEEIKDLLKEIFNGLTKLFQNLKSLLTIIVELIQNETTVDQEDSTTQSDPKVEQSQAKETESDKGKDETISLKEDIKPETISFAGEANANSENSNTANQDIEVSACEVIPNETKTQEIEN